MKTANIDNKDLKTLKYIVEHIDALFPKKFSYKYIFSEAFFIFNKTSKISLNIFRRKLFNKIYKNNILFFEKLKQDIREITEIYNLLLKQRDSQEDVFNILWNEIGFTEKDKKEFLFFIKGTPFIICSSKLEEKIDKIRKWVDNLGDEEKILIGLYYYEGLTLKEISKSLNIDYEFVVIKFSLIAFKFLFDTCIEDLHKLKK